MHNPQSEHHNMTRNYWLIAASIVAFITALIHIFLGTPEVMSPVLSANLPLASSAVLEVIWHQVSFLLIIETLIFAVAAHRKHVAWAMILPLHLLNIGIAIIFIWVGIARFGSIAPMPQWTLFLLMFVLAIIGQIRK